MRTSQVRTRVHERYIIHTHVSCHFSFWSHPHPLLAQRLLAAVRRVLPGLGYLLLYDLYFQGWKFSGISQRFPGNFHQEEQPSTISSHPSCAPEFYERSMRDMFTTLIGAWHASFHLLVERVGQTRRISSSIPRKTKSNRPNKVISPLLDSSNNRRVAILLKPYLKVSLLLIRYFVDKAGLFLKTKKSTVRTNVYYDI